jgi:hypothetical protein
MSENYNFMTLLQVISGVMDNVQLGFQRGSNHDSEQCNANLLRQCAVNWPVQHVVLNVSSKNVVLNASSKNSYSLVFESNQAGDDTDPQFYMRSSISHSSVPTQANLETRLTSWPCM